MKKADFILIAVVLVVAGVMLAFLYGGDKTGSYIQLEVDGKVVETLDLSVDRVRQIEAADSGTNTLVIKNGRASMTDANCPDKICVRHKEISRSGESIICLPHKVVVSVINEKSSDDEIDAVA